MTIQMLAGSLLVLFVPGLAWTYALFDKEIDLIERIALSVGLSLVIVPLSLFFLFNLLGMRTNFENSVYMILLLTFAALSVVIFRIHNNLVSKNK